ncbi:MAG: hypothetical protein U0Q16_19200 [Bryobacteraceae bacterium]
MPIINVQSGLDLKEAASAIFRALDIEHSELRDSDNFPGGWYWKGQIGAFTVRISESDPDDPSCSGTQYQIYLRVDSSSQTDPEDAAFMMIAELLRAGFPVVRKVSRTEAAIERDWYSFDNEGNIEIRRETLPTLELTQHS